MSKFESYIQSLGYVAHKEICEGKKGSRKWVLDPISDIEAKSFSTMVSGRFFNVWVKDNSKIYFGLNEENKPPTLISPRPNITVIRNYEGNIRYENKDCDDSMNIVLKEIPCEEIYKALFDKSIEFKFDYSDKIQKK
jgi:hypothetical protein